MDEETKVNNIWDILESLEQVEPHMSTTERLTKLQSILTDLRSKEIIGVLIDAVRTIETAGGMCNAGWYKEDIFRFLLRMAKNNIGLTTNKTVVNIKIVDDPTEHGHVHQINDDPERDDEDGDEEEQPAMEDGEDIGRPSTPKPVHRHIKKKTKW
jgi:hypothetical protein